MTWSELALVSAIATAASISFLFILAKVNDMISDWRWRRKEKAEKDAEQDKRLNALER